MYGHLAQVQGGRRLVRVEIDREVMVAVKPAHAKAVISYIRINCQRFWITGFRPIQVELAIDFLVGDSLQIYRGVIASIDEKAY